MSIRHSPRLSASNSVPSSNKKLRFAVSNAKQRTRCNTSSATQKTKNSDKVNPKPRSSIVPVPSPKKHLNQERRDKEKKSSSQVDTQARKPESNKQETKSKKPTTKTDKTKGRKLKQQMKLGKIFVKPNFPVRSIVKKNINGDHNEGKQGQTTAISRRPETNNNVPMKSLQPRIVLCKIDQHDVTSARQTRSKRNFS